jgi:hypothetical protein
MSPLFGKHNEAAAGAARPGSDRARLPRLAPSSSSPLPRDSDRVVSPKCSFS